MRTETRRYVAEQWLQNGIDEHASVAAFSVFILQMIHVGAPPEFLKRAVRAMDDEIDHARLCFRLARRFSGVAASPGRFPTQDTSGANASVESVLTATIVEGCVGETVAQRYAAAALAQATDDDVREALTKIVPDEAEHCEIAWDFTEWLIRRHPELADTARECFEQAARAIVPKIETPPGVAAYGCLTYEDKRLVHEQTWQDFIAPRARALLETATAQP